MKIALVEFPSTTLLKAIGSCLSMMILAAAPPLHAATWSSRIINPLTGRTGGSLSEVSRGGFLDPGYAADESRQHVGADYRSPTGGAAPVYAVSGGRVIWVKREESSNFNSSAIIINHQVGSQSVTVVYGHCYARSGLAVNSEIRAGDSIGELRKFNSYHLHLGANVNSSVGNFMIDSNHGWGRVPVVTSASRVAQLGWRDPVPYLTSITGGGGGSDDAGGTISTAKTIPINATVPMQMTAGDVDVLAFDVPSAGSLSASSSGSLDTLGVLMDSKGTVLASDDDTGSSYNFQIARSVNSGRYYLKVAGYKDRQVGAYGIGVTFQPSSASTSQVVMLNGSKRVSSGTLLRLPALDEGAGFPLRIVLANEGDTRARISRITLSSRDLVGTGSAPSSIRSGGTATINLRLTPSGSGTQTWSVSVTFTDGAIFRVGFRSEVN